MQSIVNIVYEAAREITVPMGIHNSSFDKEALTSAVRLSHQGSLTQGDAERSRLAGQIDRIPISVGAG